MGYLIPQPFAAGGNRSYLDFWDVTGDPRYLEGLDASPPKGREGILLTKTQVQNLRM
jgi:hypothetical protein